MQIIHTLRYFSQVKGRRRVPSIISSQSPTVFVQMLSIDWTWRLLETRCRPFP